MVDPLVRAASRSLCVLVALASAPLLATFASAGESTLGFCGEASTRIHQVQGRERSSPFLGATGVIVEAVVVGLFPGLPEGLGGFFLQEEDADADNDPLTSEGLFVFAPDFDPVLELQVGDVVRLRGQVQEFFGMTELSRIEGLIRCPRAGIATPAEPQIPVPAVDAGAPSYWERWEGMSVRIAQRLLVVDQYAAGRYGELELAATGRRLQATQQVAPGPEAVAWVEDDERHRPLPTQGRFPPGVKGEDRP